MYLHGRTHYHLGHRAHLVHITDALRFPILLSDRSLTMQQKQNDRLAMIFRALMVALFILAGIRKIMSYSATTAYFEGLGLPLPWLVTPLVIAIEIALPVLFVKGWRLREVGIVLAVYTLATGLIAHKFWSVPDAQFGNQFNHFFKNVAITGAFLLTAFSAAADRRKERAVAQA
jgi:putative oxidoreductase